MPINNRNLFIASIASCVEEIDLDKTISILRWSRRLSVLLCTHHAFWKKTKCDCANAIMLSFSYCVSPRQWCAAHWKQAFNIREFIYLSTRIAPKMNNIHIMKSKVSDAITGDRFRTVVCSHLFIESIRNWWMLGLCVWAYDLHKLSAISFFYDFITTR